MDTHDQDRHDEKTNEPKARTGRVRARLAVGLLAGLLIGGGVGFAVQAAGAAPSNEDPMGAQLPWDDSLRDDSPRSLDDEMHDGMHERMHGSDAPRGPGGGRVADRKGQLRERVDGLRGVLNREFMNVVAETIGITSEELRNGLRDGSSIADIARENGVDVQVVIDELVDTVMKNVTERITDLVNRTPPAQRD